LGKRQRFISLSDLGFIAKQGEDKVLVFANSLKTTGPVNGVTVNVYAANNQFTWFCTRMVMGIAEVPYVKKNSKDSDRVW